MVLPLMKKVWAVAALLLVATAMTSRAQVRINEIFADNKTNLFSDGSISDWVELFNTSGQAVPLAGYTLTTTRLFRGSGSSRPAWRFRPTVTCGPAGFQPAAQHCGWAGAECGLRRRRDRRPY
jgi:hypothetical protein